MPKLTIETSSGFKAEIVNVTPPRLSRKYFSSDLVEGGNIQLQVEFHPFPGFDQFKIGQNDIIEFDYPQIEIQHSFSRWTIPKKSHKKTYVRRYERKAKPYYWSREIHVTLTTTIKSIHTRETDDGTEVEVVHEVIKNC